VVRNGGARGVLLLGPGGTWRWPGRVGGNGKWIPSMERYWSDGGREGGMRPSKEGATELMKGPNGRVLFMAREVGCDQHGVAAVKPGRRRGRRKGREGVQAGGPARGDGPDDQWAGEREKTLEFNFELISRFRKFD
jgi:hypothetical protein